MKTSIKIFAIGAILTCVACGAKKSTQSKIEKNQQEIMAEGTDERPSDTERDESAIEDGGMDASNTDATEDTGTTVQTRNGSTGGNANVNADPTAAPTSENLDYLAMYEELDMTDAQIQDFETALRDFYSQQKSTASGEMMGSLSDERERQLKKILSSEQFSAYQTWKEEN
ncbi:MAG TPA: hypothetical protein VFM69_06810 [Pricia sp.]|nr:hypothetical protein [Pricia sp.]